MNYLSDPQDLQDWKDVMMKTVFPIMEALKPTYFANLLYPAPYDILKPGLTTFSIANVDDAPGGRLEQCRRRTSCSRNLQNGLASDPMAVVDQHGAVHGIDNLYVADMSVVPVSVRWPNITAYVIGEKIAHDILKASKSKDLLQTKKKKSKS